MAKSDLSLAETQAVYDEYTAARGPVVGNDNPDPFSRARFDRAQQALRENRRIWREIGEAAGKRGSFVATSDNSDTAPTLLEG